MTTTLDLDQLKLKHGSHYDRAAGVCLMEAVAWFAGEPHTDSPQCVSPYLRSFGIRLNDRATDERRQDLLRFVPLVVGTAGDGLDDRRRWIGANHVARITLPKWLDLAGLTEHAAALRALPEIVDRPGYNAARPTIHAARDAAYKLRNERRAPMLAAVRAAVTKAIKEQQPVAAAAAAAAAAVDAAAAAVAVADAVAVAAAVADAAADGRYSDRWWEIRDAVYAKVRAVYEERYADALAESWDEALELYGRLITAA